MVCLPFLKQLRAKQSLNRLALDHIQLHHVGYIIETYITDLLVSFHLRLGLAVHIVKFRPKQLKKLGGTLVV